jgi:hypothetical protein
MITSWEWGFQGRFRHYDVSFTEKGLLDAAWHEILVFKKLRDVD